MWGNSVGSDLIKQARAYLGTPFVHQGRTPAGVDCIGFVLCVLQDTGICLIDRTDYGRQPTLGLLKGELDKQLKSVPISDLSDGDIMLLRWPGGQPTHVGFYAGGNIIHAYERRGKVVEHKFIEGKPCRLVGVYRV